MSDSYYARITPVEGGRGPVDPGYGVSGEAPVHPIVLPPLPPDVHPENPIVLPPPGVPTFPIFIPGTPTHPITLPPAHVWPPLPPDAGISGNSLVLIWVVGVGYRWIVIEGPSIWPPVATPKR